LNLCRFHGLFVRTVPEGIELIQDLRTKSGAVNNQSPILSGAFTDAIQPPTQNDNLLSPRPSTSKKESKMSSLRPRALLLAAGAEIGTNMNILKLISTIKIFTNRK
jgi:hypothetical protein